MKVRKLKDITISMAPTAWQYLPEIEEQRPQDGKLQRLDGTRLCAWYVRSGMVWIRRSDLFEVRKDRGND